MKECVNGIVQYELRDYSQTDSKIILQKTWLKDTYPLHWHNYYELEYILAGEGYQILNGNRHEMQPGSLFLLTPTDFHTLTPASPTQHVKFYFEGSAIHPNLMHKILEQSTDITFQLDGQQKALFDRLFALAVDNQQIFQNTDDCAAAIKCSLELILLHILNYMGTNPSEGGCTYQKTTEMGEVLGYIHKNFRFRITLEEVAAFSHFSPTYLSKRFHKVMGITFQEYIQKQRLNFAARLLVNTKISITEICFEAGFSSLSNFTNSFKKKYEMAPSEYRSTYGNMS